MALIAFLELHQQRNALIRAYSRLGDHLCGRGMDGVELALKRHAAHPTLIRDTAKFFDKCAQRLKAASNSASEKLAALQRWREDGLLGDTQAFDDLIDELIFEPNAVSMC